MNAEPSPNIFLILSQLMRQLESHLYLLVQPITLWKSYSKTHCCCISFFFFFFCKIKFSFHYQGYFSVLCRDIACRWQSAVGLCQCFLITLSTKASIYPPLWQWSSWNTNTRVPLPFLFKSALQCPCAVVKMHSSSRAECLSFLYWFLFIKFVYKKYYTKKFHKR